MFKMDLVDTVRLIIEDDVCPVHDLHPMVDVTGNELKLSCCCANFQQECTEKIKSLFMLNPIYPYWVIA